ncbi:SOS response-associated peptidase, partial [Halomonas urmiana]|uniref:SOS response-associated peptidase n=1 Tax=Halomonas urmiana TaxID=490901 RepID=UPI001EFFAE35
MWHPSDYAPLVMDEVWWGYRLHWAKDKAPEPINATVEKVVSSNYFRGAFAHHRCLGFVRKVRSQATVYARQAYHGPEAA